MEGATASTTACCYTPPMYHKRMALGGFWCLREMELLGLPIL
jgi:hypothetical protein